MPELKRPKNFVFTLPDSRPTSLHDASDDDLKAAVTRSNTHIKTEHYDSIIIELKWRGIKIPRNARSSWQPLSKCPPGGRNGAGSVRIKTVPNMQKLRSQRGPRSKKKH